MGRAPGFAQQVASLTEAERLLWDLVSIPSPSGQEGPAAQFLVDWMTGRGFQAFVDGAGSAVGIRGQGEREIVLLGHIDTVPGWIAPRLEGRRMYGRGTVDAKGPLATFALAAAAIEPPPGTRVVVVGATQEEAATSLGARHALGQFRPRLCLIGEPSGWERITLAYKGRLLMDWSLRCPRAHSAGPAHSPAEEAVDFWQRVQGFVASENDGRRGAFDRLDAALRELNTFDEGNYGRAEMRLGFRLPPDWPPHELERRLRSLAGGSQVQFSGHEPAYVASKNTPLVRALLRAVRAGGGQPRFVYKTGTSDMNVVGPVWKCPLAAYGPGDSSLDHTPEEHVQLDEFLRAVDVLRRALGDMLAGLVAGNER